MWQHPSGTATFATLQHPPLTPVNFHPASRAALRACAPVVATGSDPGELFSFDEDQRIAIFEMVKDGSMTIEEAHAEVRQLRVGGWLGYKERKGV